MGVYEDYIKLNSRLFSDESTQLASMQDTGSKILDITNWQQPNQITGTTGNGLYGGANGINIGGTIEAPYYPGLNTKGLGQLTQRPIEGPNAGTLPAYLDPARQNTDLGRLQSDSIELKQQQDIGDGNFLGMDNKSWGTAIGGVTAGLGVLNYFEDKKLRSKQIEGLDENIAGARAERSALANYRKAYGA